MCTFARLETENILYIYNNNNNKKNEEKNTQPKQQQMKCPKDLRQNAAVENNELYGCLHTRITVASH